MEVAMVGEVMMPIGEARISAHDRSVYFGDGVYEVVRSWRGKLFAMEEHMARLGSSLAKMEMLDKVDLGVIRARVVEALASAGIDDAVVYFQVTRGSGVRSHGYGDDWAPGFLLTVRERKGDKPEEARAITHADWRWKRCDIKSLNLLANVMAKRAAMKAGVYDAILVDEAGWVTESTSSSVLLVKEGVLRTAPLGANILAGITRGLLLEWAGQLGLEVREESFRVAEALGADELMLTGTSTEVTAVTELDGQRIGGGREGQYTGRLGEMLRAAMYQD